MVISLQDAVWIRPEGQLVEACSKKMLDFDTAIYVSFFPISKWQDPLVSQKKISEELWKGLHKGAGFYS